MEEMRRAHSEFYQIEWSYIDNGSQQEWCARVVNLPHTFLEQRKTKKEATRALLKALLQYQVELTSLRNDLKNILAAMGEN